MFILPTTAMHGVFTFHTDKRGKVAEFSNLIVDNGLDAIGLGNFGLNYCYVGMGTTQPSELETNVPPYRGVTSTTYGSVLSSRLTESPYYIWTRKTFRFAQGSASGNLTEVSISQLPNGAGLMSRALIKDDQGNPTAISILSDEILDVTYELRTYPPLNDVTGILVLEGNKGGTHNWIMRASRIQEPTAQYSPGWDAIPNATSASSYNTRVYTGAIGDLFGIPSGLASSELVVSRAGDYVPGSFKQQYIVTADASRGNLSIRSLRMSLLAPFQIEFDPIIQKTASDIFSLKLEVSWGRHAP